MDGQLNKETGDFGQMLVGEIVKDVKDGIKSVKLPDSARFIQARDKMLRDENVRAIITVVWFAVMATGPVPK